jgi:hypothetical protein
VLLLAEPLGDQELAHAVTLHRSVRLTGRGAQRREAGAFGIGRHDVVGACHARGRSDYGVRRTGSVFS